MNEFKLVRNAYLVLGAEGSGTYMMRDALVSAGCSWDSRFDSFEYEPTDLMRMKNLFVFRRSIPHADQWPKIDEIIHHLKMASYKEIIIIWMIREMHSTIKSVANRRRKEASGDELLGNYFATFPLQQQIPNWPISENLIMITYGYFVTSEPYRRWLFRYRFYLPYPEKFAFYDGNRKYFSEFDDEWND